MLGGVVVAVVLVVGVTVGLAGYGGALDNALCKFSSAVGIGGGCTGAPVVAAPKTDADYKPGVCMISEDSEKYSAEVKIAWFTIGESSGFIVQTFSDGSVRATMVDGASLGASGNLGSKTFDLGKLGDGEKAGADVKLGGGLKFEYGSTWQFADMKQFESMKDQLDDYLIQQETITHGGEGSVGYTLYLSLFDKWVDPPKEPKITYGKIGIEASLKANAGSRIGTGKVDSGGKEKFIDPKVGFNLSVTAGASAIVMNDLEKGTTSYTYEVSGSGKIGADLVLDHITGEGKVNGAFTTTYGKDGALTELTFKSAYEYGGSFTNGNNTFKSISGGVGEGETDSVVTTTKLTVTDDNRAAVEAWMADRSSVAGTALSLPVNAMIPDHPSDDPFLQLMHEQAKTSQVTYHNIKDTTEFGMAIKKGWEFGFSVSSEEATATKTDAHFLGAPQADGVRVMIPNSECK